MSFCNLGTCSSFRCRTTNCPVPATLGEVRTSSFEEGKGSLGFLTGLGGEIQEQIYGKYHEYIVCY